MSEGGHWYYRDGQSCHEVPNKSKGGMRPTRITDAKKLGLLPSVTTLFKALAKPELDQWKLKQVILQAIKQPHSPREPKEAYITRIIEDAFKQVDDAADLGTNIHLALENHFQGKSYDKAYKVYVDAVEKWAVENKVTFEKHELRLVCGEYGYAGTTDARIRVEDREGYGTLDFKSRKSKPEYPMSPWATEPMQIAAYGHVEGSDFGVNVYISTVEAGRVEAVWYDKPRLDREFEAFKHVIAVWQHFNNFYPNALQESRTRETV